MEAAVRSNNLIGTNVAGQHALSTPRVTVQFQQVEQCAGEVHRTIAPKIGVMGSAPAAKSVSINNADVKTPQNSNSDNWQTAKKVAVVALPIIGLAAFIGLSVGAGIATGGIGFLPLIAGGIILATFAASAAISVSEPNLWDDMPIPPQNSEKKTEDKEEEKVSEDSSEIPDLVDSITIAEEENEEVDIEDMHSELFNNDEYINSLVYKEEEETIINNEFVNNENPIAASSNLSQIDEPEATKIKQGILQRIGEALTGKKDASKYDPF